MEGGSEGAEGASETIAPTEQQGEPGTKDGPTEDEAATRSFKIVHPRRRPKKAAPPPRGVKYPLLQLISTSLGLVSLLLPWVVTQSFHGDEYTRLTECMTDPQAYSAIYTVAGVLVLIGSVFVMASPYGGLLTLAGVAAFMLDLPSGTSEAGLGLMVAAAGAAVGCTSILWHPAFRMPSKLLSVKVHPMGGHRLNVLAYAAFAMGMVSMVLYWIVVTQSMGGDSIVYGDTLASLMDDPNFGSGQGYLVAEAMVVAGCVLCLLTPLGGPVMLSGALLFLYKIRDTLGTSELHYGSLTSDVGLGYGFYLCMIASIMATVSIFKAYEARVRFASIAAGEDNAAPEPPPAEAPLSMAALTKAALKPAAVIMLVLLMLLATVMVSFALPLSTLVVSVSSSDATSAVEAAVYVDGTLIQEGFASNSASLIVECAVTAGSHRVELDYAMLDFVPGGPDGQPDWSSSVDVRPYVRYLLLFPVLRDDLALPLVTLDATDTMDGERVTVVKSVNYAYGVEFEADITWNYMSLVLTDGSSFAEWEPDGMELSGWSAVQSDLGAAFLGDLNITCTVTDLAGDSHMSQGDYFDLAVVSGSFDGDELYTFYVLSGGSVVGDVSFTG
jgi:hypothetical protein